jgi:hypothetical protein
MLFSKPWLKRGVVGAHPNADGSAIDAQTSPRLLVMASSLPISVFRNKSMLGIGDIPDEVEFRIREVQGLTKGSSN